jgi:hypothetical protein
LSVWAICRVEDDIGKLHDVYIVAELEKIASMTDNGYLRTVSITIATMKIFVSNACLVCC